MSWIYRKSVSQTLRESLPQQNDAFELKECFFDFTNGFSKDLQRKRKRERERKKLNRNSSTVSFDDLKPYSNGLYQPLKAKGCVRIGTFNIHMGMGYRMNYKVPRYKEIVAAIRQLDADVLVLNEVTGKCLKAIVNVISYPYTKVNLPNVICSKFPFKPSSHFETFSSSYFKVDSRNFISVSVEPTPGTKICIIGTHLDVFDETGETRCNQLEQILSYVKNTISTVDQTESRNICCIGDMNAIHRSDYSRSHWEWIVDQDEKRMVKTTTNAMDLMYGKEGWLDAFDITENIQGGPKLSGIKPAVSVWSMRKVDHLMLVPDWNLPVKNAMILYNPASDHLPVAMDVYVGS
mmetsp:Transcript_2061/g.2357  ORF Transcript_2061/g.2357 Transcript_2061/m.2357 type:complete len:349 (-) Transcript_2061:117-1163(-)